MKNVVAGLGEIGYPIYKLLSKSGITVGYDVDEKLMDKKSFEKNKHIETSFLHICIPYNAKFDKNVILLNKKFNPKCIVIHSTIRPYTTQNLTQKLSIPVIYSATRGIHRRMINDMKRYTKFFSIEKDAPDSKWASSEYSKLIRKSGLKVKKMSSPVTLELAKILVDTSYYGWIINYAQLTATIAQKHNVDYDEMWTFSDEIHKFLGNRPKMFPGFIGGHCVIPNLELYHDKTLNLINELNEKYGTKFKKQSKKTKRKKSKTKKK